MSFFRNHLLVFEAVVGGLRSKLDCRVPETHRFLPPQAEIIGTCQNLRLFTSVLEMELRFSCMQGKHFTS